MKYLTYLGIIIMLFSCQEQAQQNTNNSIETAEAIVSEPDLNNIVIQNNDFSEIDSTGILYFPLNVYVDNEGRDSYISSKSKGYSNFIWNIIFYNAHTSQAHLLTDEKILIEDFSIYKNSSHDIEMGKEVNAIFYRAKINDYNQDGKLDYNDPTYLFVSDKSGDNFRQLSPDNHDLQSWNYVESVGKIFLNALPDINGDLQFDEKDEVSTFEVSLETNAQPKSIFQKDLIKKVKTLYARDWVESEN